MRDLEGKVALVTGASRGIGRAVALSLVERGANIVVGYLRKRSLAEEVCRLAEDHAVKAVPVRVNVGETASLEAMFDTVEETFARLDVFVSNAASGVIRDLDGLDERAWDWTFDVNARPLFRGAKRAAAMMEDGGSIVALSSGGSQRVLPGYMVVGASKAAIESLARYLAVDLGPRGITVNVIAPGVVDTDALTHFPARETIITEATAKTPTRRLTTPDDVAQAVTFLTSDAARCVNGHVLVMDGGASLVA